MKLLRVKEAAELLRMHPMSIYRRVKAGEIKCFRTKERGLILIPQEEIERLLKTYERSEENEER